MIDLVDFRNGLFDGLLLTITAGGIAWLIKLSFALWNGFTK